MKQKGGRKGNGKRGGRTLSSIDLWHDSVSNPQRSRGLGIGAQEMVVMTEVAHQTRYRQRAFLVTTCSRKYRWKKLSRFVLYCASPRVDVVLTMLLLFLTSRASS